MSAGRKCHIESGAGPGAYHRISSALSPSKSPTSGVYVPFAVNWANGHANGLPMPMPKPIRVSYPGPGA